MLCSDKKESNRTAPETDTGKSKHERLCTDNEGSVVAASTIDKSKRNPVLIMPTIEAGESKHARLCTGKDGPICKKSSANKAGAGCAMLRRGTDKPKRAVSTTGREKTNPTHDKPRRGTALSDQANPCTDSRRSTKVMPNAKSNSSKCPKDRRKTGEPKKPEDKAGVELSKQDAPKVNTIDPEYAKHLEDRAESKWTKPKTNTTRPRRAEERSDKSESETEDSITERVNSEPAQDKPKTSTTKPKREWDRRDEEESIWVKPKTNENESNHAKLRGESAGPRVVASTTKSEKTKPTRLRPRTKATKSTRTKLCTDNGNPRLPKLKANNTLPRCAKLLANGHLDQLKDCTQHEK